MASVVGTLGGIKYGAKLYGYFVLVGILGGIITLVGLGIVISGLGLPVTGSVAASTSTRLSPNVGRIALGAVTALTGLGVTQAGFIGAIYKVVTDAVYTGNIKSRNDTLSDNG